MKLAFKKKIPSLIINATKQVPGYLGRTMEG